MYILIEKCQTEKLYGSIIHSEFPQQSTSLTTEKDETYQSETRGC